MATKSQISANQANARRSTGPRTPQGKAKSSQNALKHGLRAEAVILPGENLDDFDVLVSELEDEFQPAGAIEWTLLRQLADAEWRMRRVPLIEAGVLAREHRRACEHFDDHPDQLPDDPDAVDIFLIGAMAVGDAIRGDVLAKLSRYESRLSHRYFKALAHLRALQDRRLSPAGDAGGAHQQNPAPAGEPAPSHQNGRTNPIPTPANPIPTPATAACRPTANGSTRERPYVCLARPSVSQMPTLVFRSRPRPPRLVGLQRRPADRSPAHGGVIPRRPRPRRPEQTTTRNRRPSHKRWHR